MKNYRKQAAFISLIAAAGNLAVLTGMTAITYGYIGISETVSVMASVPAIVFMLFAGVVTLIIGIVLLTQADLSKKARLGLFLLSIVMLGIAAVQKSIVAIFLLFLPWSLYKFYQSQIA
jgi:hypothetical protein